VTRQRAKGNSSACDASFMRNVILSVASAHEPNIKLGQFSVHHMLCNAKVSTKYRYTGNMNSAHWMHYVALHVVPASYIRPGGLITCESGPSEGVIAETTPSLVLKLKQLHVVAGPVGGLLVAAGSFLNEKSENTA
jgi:hypothetical protein